jgi:hypothetical protein
MNDDWRSRIKMTKHDGLKAAVAIIGLMAACIVAVWLLGRVLRSNPPAQPAPELPAQIAK